MAYQDGAPGHGEINPLVALGVPDTWTEAAIEDGEQFGWGAVFAVGSAREEFAWHRLRGGVKRGKELESFPDT